MTVSDSGGPDHRSEVETLAIDGVVRERFPRVAYQHGSLTEVVNRSWHDMFDSGVEHLYLISNPNAESRDEWYVHQHVTDRYVIVDGHLDVALYDGRADSPTAGTLLVTELLGIEDDGFAGLRIPNGVWHSFSSRRERLILMNAKSPGYDRTKPDKQRMPMPNDEVDFSWSSRV